MFNLENKRLLRLFAHPVAVSTLYMFVGGVLGWLSWRLGVVRQPAFSRVQVRGSVATAPARRSLAACIHTPPGDRLSPVGTLPCWHEHAHVDVPERGGCVAFTHHSGAPRCFLAAAAHTASQATEPLFVTAAASLVLGTRPSARLVWSLVPIVVGVSVASATDVSFSWLGFTAALGSNLASTARNVYSKQVMSGMRGDIDRRVPNARCAATRP